MTSRQLESRQDQCTWAFNVDSIGPCSLDPNTICQGSLETVFACACSPVSYYLAAACEICQTSDINLSWDLYAQPFNCGTNVNEFPPSLSTGEHVIPSWALAMGTETPSPTTFDLAAAASLASFISVNSAFPSPTPTSITPPFGGSRTSSPSNIPTSATGSQQTASSTESRGSTTNPTATSSQKSVPSTARNALPAGAIVGIVFGVCSILSLGILLVWLARRRYRRRQTFTSPIPIPSPASVTSFPSNGDASDDSAAGNISTVRRQYLQRELRAAQEKIVDIEDVERHAEPTRTTRGLFPERKGRILRLLSARSTTTTGSGSTDHDLSLRERNEMLTARIRELEGQLRSPWALGLSDEPPPGYSEE